MNSKAELIEYCEQYQSDIFVRFPLCGKWGTYALSDIPFAGAMEFINKWWDDRLTPPRRIPTDG